jgi:ABC-type glycerol-3-phosphate transport system substrate-binding protein
MKRSLAVVLAVVLMMTTLLIGCGSKGENVSKENTSKNDTTEQNKEQTKADEAKEWSGTIKVQMIGSWKMEDSTDPVSGEKTKGVHVLKEEFEKTHPGATVEFILMGWDSYMQKTQAMIMSNECDVYQIPGIASLTAQGLLEPLAPYIERDQYDVGQYINGQVDGWKTMGPEDKDLQIYGLPVLGDTRVILYDKKLFDDWGVEYLSEEPTMDEIMEKAKKMTGKNPVTGEKNYGAFFRGPYAADTAMNIAESLGGTWGSGFKWEDMKVNFNSPEMKEAVQDLKDIMQYCPDGVISDQGKEFFLTENNNIAMHLRQAPKHINSLYAAGLEERYAAALLFVNPEEGKGQAFPGSPCGIGKDSENKDLAWEYLKFTGSEFYQKYLWEEYTMPPVLKSAAEWESIKNAPMMDVVLKSMGRLWTPRYPYRSGQPRYILAANVEKALLGDMSIEEALDTAQKETEEWLKNQ